MSARRKETWWWNDTVDRAIKAKRQAWKEWRKWGSREKYQVAKREAKHQVYVARREAESKKFANVLRREDQRRKVFRIARQCVSRNQDVLGEKCVRNDSGALTTTNAERKDAWNCHYGRVMNVENVWEREALTPSRPNRGASY